MHGDLPNRAGNAELRQLLASHNSTVDLFA